MDRVLDSKKISPHTLAGVGVAVHAKGTHIGLLYRDNDNEPVVLLHLGWHNSLRREAVSPAYACWVRPAVHPDRADAVAAFCRRIWKQNSHGRVPYGLSKPGRVFDRSGAPFKALEGAGRRRIDLRHVRPGGVRPSRHPARPVRNLADPDGGRPAVAARSTRRSRIGPTGGTRLRQGVRQ